MASPASGAVVTSTRPGKSWSPAGPSGGGSHSAVGGRGQSHNVRTPERMSRLRRLVVLASGDPGGRGPGSAGGGAGAAGPGDTPHLWATRVLGTVWDQMSCPLSCHVSVIPHGPAGYHGAGGPVTPRRALALSITPHHVPRGVTGSSLQRGEQRSERERCCGVRQQGTRPCPRPVPGTVGRSLLGCDRLLGPSRASSCPCYHHERHPWFLGGGGGQSEPEETQCCRSKGTQ